MTYTITSQHAAISSFASMSHAIPRRAGIGLRQPHFHHVITDKPAVPWLEVHTENFFQDGGAAPEFLESIRQHYPLSLHGVGLSLGSATDLDKDHLKKIKSLIKRLEPGLVSEHLSWSTYGDKVANDLLPLPYTEESLEIFCNHIDEVQTYLGTQILIENPSTYIEYNFSTIPEWEFLVEINRRTGCGILLDINNIYVGLVNHGYDAYHYISCIPVDAVKEIHLAGHLRQEVDGHPLLIDNHGDNVTKDVWKLYQIAVNQFGHIPTLIEWDVNIPDFEVLQIEAQKAEEIMFAQTMESL